MEQKEKWRPIRYCPKQQCWIFSDECRLQDDCWDVPEWGACIVMRKEVSKGALLLEEFLAENTTKEETT